MREAGVENETHAMGGTHEKGAIFSAPILPRSPPSRVSRAPRPFVLNSGEKSVCFAGYFIFKICGQNPIMSPLQVILFSRTFAYHHLFMF